MVLATIIRLEMAYPGVGILAGDSLQYLSVVTAHAVIMVFFMIMPLLFGAFGNFLLPTQLGVHDVAFPRLNSAAFWFLPAGLLMLVQLVCLDRRYQRMNCYNIREIQTILKSKYAPNSMDSSPVHFSLNDTVVGLRYQLGGPDILNNATLSYYQNSVATSPKVSSLYEFRPVSLKKSETLSGSSLTGTFGERSIKSPTLFEYVMRLSSSTLLTQKTNNVFGTWFPSLYTPLSGFNVVAASATTLASSDQLITAQKASTSVYAPASP